MPLIGQLRPYHSCKFSSFLKNSLSAKGIKRQKEKNMGGRERNRLMPVHSFKWSEE